MENPAVWGTAEHVVQGAYLAWDEARRKGVTGMSLTFTITNALREAGLLREETTDDTEDRSSRRPARRHGSRGLHGPGDAPRDAG